MPIYHYTGYISKEEAAHQYRVQVRTINTWIKNKSIAPKPFSFITVDGYHAIKDLRTEPIPVPGISLSALEWVRNFATKNKMFFERVYEEIIKGKISGIVIADR